MLENYSKSVDVTATPEKVYKAITEQIDRWWTTKTNQATVVNDHLRVEFEGKGFAAMKVIKAIPNQSLTWEVLDACMGHKEQTKKDEWVGSYIQWLIQPQDNGCRIEMVHQGLTSELECWDVCFKGWNYFLGSLKSFLDTGEGTPFSPDS